MVLLLRKLGQKLKPSKKLPRWQKNKIIIIWQLKNLKPPPKRSVKKTKSLSRAKKVVKSLAEGRLYIQSTFNNTIVTITDTKGNTLAWSSAGQCGFKGSRKSTPYAATTAIEKALDAVRPIGIKKLAVYLKGPGTGRDAALRFLRTKGILKSI